MSPSPVTPSQILDEQCSLAQTFFPSRSLHYSTGFQTRSDLSLSLSSSTPQVHLLKHQRLDGTLTLDISRYNLTASPTNSCASNTWYHQPSNLGVTFNPASPSPINTQPHGIYPVSLIDLPPGLLLQGPGSWWILCPIHFPHLLKPKSFPAKIQFLAAIPKALPNLHLAFSCLDSYHSSTTFRAPDTPGCLWPLGFPPHCHLPGTLLPTLPAPAPLVHFWEVFFVPQEVWLVPLVCAALA